MPFPCIPRRARACLSTAIALLALPQARSQAQQPDLVPRELAVAHARLFAPERPAADPTILVGDVPASTRADFPTPPGAEIIGSIVWRTSVQVIGKAPGTPTAVASWLWHALESAGWTRPLPDAGSLDGGGFIEAPDPASSPSILCRNGQSVEVKAIPLDPVRSYYQITLKRGRASCAMDRVYRGATQWSDGGNRLPVLYNPRDAQMNTVGCQVQRSRDTQSNVAVSTGLSPAALLASYGRQLDSAGWRETTPNASGAAGTWTRTDSAGTTLRAELAVLTVPSAPSCRAVRLEISTPPIP